MFICIYLFILSSFALLSQVDWSSNSQSYVVNTIQYDQSTTYFYTASGSYPINEQAAFTVHLNLQNTTVKQLTSTFSQIKRPQFGSFNDQFILLHNSDYEIYNVSTSLASPYLTSSLSEINSMSPMSVMTKTFNGIDKTFIATCSDKSILIYNTNFTLLHSTNLPCGYYLSFGYSNLAVKNTTAVEIYNVDSTGSLSLIRMVQLNFDTSETAGYDPMVMSRFDVLYSSISDQNKIQVNSPHDKYISSDFITNVPFYTKNTQEFVSPLYASNINTYGNLIVIGTFGYSQGLTEKCGGVVVYFDNHLVKKNQRFELVWNYTGTVDHQYMGYTVALMKDIVFVGGKVDIVSNQITNNTFNISKYVSKYCSTSECACPSHYYYNVVFRQCLPQISTPVLIVVLCLLMIIVLLSVITFIILFIKYDNPSKYTPLNEDLISITPNIISFGDNTPVHTTLTKSLLFESNSPTDTTVTFHIPNSYRYIITFPSNTMQIKPNSSTTIEVSITYLCHCNATEEMVIEVNKDIVKLPIECQTDNDFMIDPTDVILHDKIGSNSYGNVFISQYNDNKYRTKSLTLTFTIETLEQVQTTMLMYQKCNSPYLQSIEHVAFSNTSCYILTTYQEGQVLLDLINSNEIKSYNNTILFNILLNITKALKVLHDLNIPHHSVKPSNILIPTTLSTNEISPILMDSGCTTFTTFTHEIYTPPEQIQGNELTISSDIYQFGICFINTFSPNTIQSFKWSNDILNQQIPLNIPDIPFNQTIQNMIQTNSSLRPSITDVLSSLSQLISES
ncbi:Serine-threonine protein kinase [Entamoeba marina]